MKEWERFNERMGEILKLIWLQLRMKEPLLLFLPTFFSGFTRVLHCNGITLQSSTQEKYEEALNN